MAWTQDKINEIYMDIQRLAVTDEEFRRELLENPEAVIAKTAGEELPEDFKVNVIESDPEYTATFVLPPMLSDELDDTDLANVAGGLCGLYGCGAQACAADGKLSIK